MNEEKPKSNGVPHPIVEAETNISDVSSLPDYNFSPIQQQVYDAVMSGKAVSIRWGWMSGKTYVFNAVREDLAIIRKLLNECFPNEEKKQSQDFCPPIPKCKPPREEKNIEIPKWEEILQGWKELCQDRKKQINELRIQVTGLKLAELENRPKPIKVEMIGCEADGNCKVGNYSRQLYRNIFKFINKGICLRVIDIEILTGNRDNNCALILYEELSTDATNGKDEEN